MNGLPTRFHIGLQRTGSTYLYELLTSHPDISLPRKGLGFYANKFDRGMEWYLSQFPPTGVRIDPSPVYLVHGRIVAPRIKEALAGKRPRFLVILRNPIDYTASRFLLHGRTKGLRKRFGESPHDLETLLQRHPEYLNESRYADLLERCWFPHFARDDFHIIMFEDFIRDQSVTAGVVEFFGLPPHPLTAAPTSRNATLRHPVLHTVKAAIVARPRLHAALRGNPVMQRLYDRFLVSRGPKLNPSRRAWLRDLLAADVARLKELLGNPLAGWRDFQ